MMGKQYCRLNTVCGHLNMPHLAKGMCNTCYEFKRYASNRENQIKRVIEYNKTSKGLFNKLKNQKAYNESEKGKETSKRYMSTVKYKLAMKRSKKKNALNIKMSNIKCRALKYSTTDGSVTTEAILNLFKSQNGLCNNPNCKVKLEDNYHIDHIFPLSKGGEHTISNIQLLCPFCNLSKKDKVLVYNGVQ
jgi:5-methylcytosine-specific restriction endonuclease McrA